MTATRKPIISVSTADDTQRIYSITATGNRSFRLWINDSAVDAIFGTEKEAFAYAKSCANIDRHFYGCNRIDIIQ